jgi:hypothetical protein
MATYYAVTHANGPISISIEADSPEEAIAAAFETDEPQDIIDDASTDAEDELGFEGSDCSSGEFDAALEAHGCEFLRRFGEDTWELWRAPEEPVDPMETATVKFLETAEEREGDPPDPHTYCYYIMAEVWVAGEEYHISTMVGAPLSEHGSIEAAGCGVRPHCTAWTIDASDMQDVPSWLKPQVRELLIKNSYQLFCAAEAQEEKRAAGAA